MENVSLKLTLTALKCAMMESPNTGEPLLVIPVNQNNLFRSEKGNIYLDLIAFPMKTPTKDQTHIVKQSLPKDVREKMSPEDQKSQPILGNLKIWGDTPGQHEEQAPAAAPAEMQAAAKDLPF